MEVILTDIGKRFNTQWIFKGITHTFKSGSANALIGNNGSGKSTLLQIIYNFQTFSKGSISFQLSQQILLEEELPGQISLAAPYLDLPEEFTLNEVLKFHFNILPVKPSVSLSKAVMEAGLNGQENKYIKYFSSGMKQRLKLLLAFNTQNTLLLLDEPCSNLDDKGIEWYQTMLANEIGNRTIIIASNQPYEYEGCANILNVTQFKP